MLFSPGGRGAYILPAARLAPSSSACVGAVESYGTLKQEPLVVDADDDVGPHLVDHLEVEARHLAENTLRKLSPSKGMSFSVNESPCTRHVTSGAALHVYSMRRPRSARGCRDA